MNQAGRSRLQRFSADASRSDEKLRPQCKHRAATLSSFPLPAFSIVCAMSSFTGRWFKGHGCIVAVWVSKNRGFLQSGNFGCISGVKEGENGDFEYKSADSPGHWTGIFTDKGNETEICFTECVEVKKWLMKPFVKSYLKKQQAQFVADIRKTLGGI